MEDLSIPDQEPIANDEAMAIAWCVLCHELIQSSRRIATIVAEDHSRNTGHRTLVNDELT